MTSDYKKICEENRGRYGTEGAKIAGELATNLYDDKTHFILELLQNAEDALGKRGKQSGKRNVTFVLKQSKLILSHFGVPFDDDDVRSVCDIRKSTKNESSIGRFGLGFKSVYAVTLLPEIHSGEHDFGIEDYVYPKKVSRTLRQPDETQIILPLRSDKPTIRDDITIGFRRLEPRVLLFLRNIEKINWSVEGSASGSYKRYKPEVLGPNAQHIRVIGDEEGQDKVDEHWLIFHREVSFEEKFFKRIEIAFSLYTERDEFKNCKIKRVPKSPLVVFFPTILETDLGFLVQGPYQTTTSRDNIIRNNTWNEYLVKETTELFLEALRWLRDQSILDTSALRCLPLDPNKFSEDTIFAPMFHAVREALLKEPLLPKFGGGYVEANKTRLARTKEIRELFDPEQIATLLSGNMHGWLSEKITENKTPELRNYLMQQIKVEEITPETIVKHLNIGFLEAQSDDWTRRLYEFLNGQTGYHIRKSIKDIPLIRLVDGSHVMAYKDGNPQVYFPRKSTTNFPTVRPSVIETDESREFLTSLEIIEPDPVASIIQHILPTYKEFKAIEDANSYALDINHILEAYQSDSQSRQNTLISALKETPFVRVLNAGNGRRYLSRPGEIYLATDRLKKLFSGVSNIMIVDDTYECLRGDSIRKLLEACGSLRYPRPITVHNTLSMDERHQLRKDSGNEETSGITDKVEDWTLDGFEELMKILPKLSPEDRAVRARLIWESLGDLEERRRGIFHGLYCWSYYGKFQNKFTSNFVRLLNEDPWIPDESGNLSRPCQVMFETLGWSLNPFLGKSEKPFPLPA